MRAAPPEVAMRLLVPILLLAAGATGCGETASTGQPARQDASSPSSSAPPGGSELCAYESSAEDGSRTWLDSKRVTLSR